MDNKGTWIVTTIILIIGFLLAGILIGTVTINSIAYRRGQVDALNGVWKYQLIDGEVWEKK